MSQWIIALSFLLVHVCEQEGHQGFRVKYIFGIAFDALLIRPEAVARG